jgi:putative redox protein
LAACTSQTLRLYAKRKGWPLGPVRVSVSHSRNLAQTLPDILTVVVALSGPLDDEQRGHLLNIAGRCPVHLMLTGGSSVSTSLAAPTPLSPRWTPASARGPVRAGRGISWPRFNRRSW